MKKLTSFVAALFLSLATFAEPMTVIINYSDVPDGFTQTTGTSGTFTLSEVDFAYAGINTKSKADADDHAYKYLMFCKDNGVIASTSAPVDHYVSKIVVKYSGTTGESGKVGAKFTAAAATELDAAIATYSPQKNGKTTFLNADQTLGYWNVSTKTANIQIVSIEVEYTHVGEEPSITHVTSISLDQTELELVEKTSGTLTATVLPMDADNQTITWTTSDDAVATVANGVVTAVAEGEATITVTAEDGGFTATCAVTVTAKPKQTLEGDIFSIANFAATSNQYKDTVGVVGVSGAEYAANTAASNGMIQMRVSSTDQAKSGIVTTKSAGKLKKVMIDWDLSTNPANSIDIYAKNEPYTSVADLYDSEKCGTKVGKIKVGLLPDAVFDFTELADEYEYVALKAVSGAVRMEQVSVAWQGTTPPGPGPDPEETAYYIKGDFNGAGWTWYDMTEDEENSVWTFTGTFGSWGVNINTKKEDAGAMDFPIADWHFLGDITSVAKGDEVALSFDPETEILSCIVTKAEGLKQTVVVKVTKTVEDGQLVIIRDGVRYNATGVKF